MPDYKVGPIVHDDPRRLEKVKIKVSPEGKAKGKKGLKDPATGFTFSDDQMLTAEVLSLSVLPSSKILPTPTPGNQGSEGSCVSWACSTARSVEQYFLLGSSSYNNAINVMSPEYLFDYVNLGCTGGSTLLDNLDILKNKGVCTWASLPYTSGTCDVSIASPHDAEAADYKITEYFIISMTDRTAVKTNLNNNKAIVIYVQVDTAFYNAGPGFVWNSTTHAGTSLVGQHECVIIGYDDSRNAYKLQNSWGTGWADGGYCWVDYEFAESGLGTGTLGIVINGATPTAVLPTLPVADAGYDTTIPSTQSVILSGTASYDPNGYIASYLWEQTSGPNTATVSNNTSAVASASALIPGTYIFRLTVTDNDGNTATDSVTITAVSVEVTDLTVTKTVTKGKATDHVSWNIVSSVPVLYAEIKITTASSSTIYPINNPFRYSGTYDYVPYYQKQTRYYQLKVVKSDGTIAYSLTKNIR